MKVVHVPIGETFEFVRNGKNIKQDKNVSGLPITRIETISSGFIDPERVGYANVAEAGNEKWLLSVGDILFSHINSPDHIGKCALYEGKPSKLIHGMNLLALRPKTSILDPQYAFRALSAPAFRASLQPFVNKAVNQASVSTTNLKSLTIPLPPLDEQRRIAAILGKADALRRKRKRALELIDQLKISLFLGMFGNPVSNPMSWHTDSLGNLCDVRDGTHESPKYVAQGFPLLTSKNFSGGKLDVTNAKLISESDYNSINKRSKVDVSDIVMPMIGTIGSPVLITTEPNFAIKNVALFKFKSNSRVIPEYVHAVLDGPLLAKKILDSGRGGAQKFLSLGDLRALAVPVPPRMLQNEFKSAVSSLQATRDSQSASAYSTEILFTSLQHRAFSGQL